ncbi:hypothetical protein GQ53DRAFT_811321 [Thozetella sp. PMI_491]|nr:hypothetical protein GQ53DRAFT_811321 [Thozetella sp. PMI_491]
MAHKQGCWMPLCGVPLSPNSQTSFGVASKDLTYAPSSLSPLQMAPNMSLRHSSDATLFQSSFGHGAAELDQPIIPSSNGFVDTLIHAYGQHHHLVIRPDDVWIAILAQFSLYFNAHAEELRNEFVSHEGKQEIRIEYNPFSIFTFDFSAFALDVAKALETLVVDPELRTWMVPDFTTTTQNDKIVASIVMMGTLQQYFEYTCGIICGFPTVQLLGEKSDYEALLLKVDKLEQYGDEPKEFASLLRPILRRFILSFDEPGSEEVIRFWRRVFDSDDSICGVTWYTGWITAFCFWDKDGYHRHYEHDQSNRYTSDPDVKDTQHLVLDGIRYPGVDKENVPPAWVKVPIKVEQDKGDVAAEMFAGIMGIRLSSKNASLSAMREASLMNEFGNSTGQKVLSKETLDGMALDSMSPIASWWITEKIGPERYLYREKLDEEHKRQLEEE